MEIYRKSLRKIRIERKKFEGRWEVLLLEEDNLKYIIKSVIN